ncbi:MAG: hypothetical protein KatS3mg104_1171 [Phycisphaerae bacterium]|jgi:hypothetical protein|nr:MAG: hypothetical protein KatS3mg104_1171 [Phycisphaerae bacterium]
MIRRVVPIVVVLMLGLLSTGCTSVPPKGDVEHVDRTSNSVLASAFTGIKGSEDKAVGAVMSLHLRLSTRLYQPQHQHVCQSDGKGRHDQPPNMVDGVPEAACRVGIAHTVCYSMTILVKIPKAAINGIVL